MTGFDLDSKQGMSRRGMLTRSAAGLGIALSGSVSGLFGTLASPGVPHGGHGAAGYGPLVDDPAGLLSLPEGFEYTIVAQSGVTRLDTGEPTPSDPDGTAAFLRRGGSGIVYDDEAGGGTTNIVVDRRGNRIREYVSLAGTSTNCAGGHTPWDTWLTCEETEATLGKPHGYVFEVDPYDQRANHDPQPIKALGRYAHEALVVDPRGGRIYLTEDAGSPNGLLYRWTPPRAAVPLRHGSLRRLADDAGTLEAMRASTLGGDHVPDLSPATTPGTTYRIEWVAVPDRDATAVSTRKQFTADRITRSRKYEGMWWGHGRLLRVLVCAHVRRQRRPARRAGVVPGPTPRHDRAQAALRLHAHRPGHRPRRPRQHHGLALRRRDHRRGR